MNIIETGGTVNDFIKIIYLNFIDYEETEEECINRRKLEDFIKKKEWKHHSNN